MRLYGKNSVWERLKSAPETVNKIYIEKGLNLENIVRQARERQVLLAHMPQKKFFNFTNGIRCQGVVAEVTEFTYNYLEDFLSREREELLSLIFLDRITDPQNLGAIIRTLACFGGFGLIIPKHDSASINDTVLKVACGGESFLPIAQVSNLSIALDLVKSKGYWVVGAVTENGEDFSKAKLLFPLAIVIGSEDKGIRQGLKSHLDFKFSLPMPGRSLSFNAATATAIFCYEIFKQKNKK